MDCLAKIVDGSENLTIFAKHSIFDIWQGSEYASKCNTRNYISAKQKKPVLQNVFSLGYSMF